MTEPTIICPNCKSEIKLTESLAGPLLEATRLDFERRLALKESDISAREAALSKAKESLDDQVAEKMKQERAKIVADEARKAKLVSATEMEQKAREVSGH